MKRIMNDVAVRTVCYTLSGLQQIAIYDYENNYDMLKRKDGTLVCSGKLCDVMYNWENGKWFDSKVWGISVEDETIVFDIFTRYEQYR